MTVLPNLPPQADLTQCEREPIHIPGSIQPHGVLMTFSRPDLTLVHASRNAEALLGGRLEDAFGQTLDALAPNLMAAFGADLLADRAGASSVSSRPFDHASGKVEAVVHDIAAVDLAVLELEYLPDAASAPVSLDVTLRGFVENLRSARTVEDLCALAAATIRRVTGFDRVLVYRFDEHWNGTVVAEDGNGVLPSYLDLRFPASDIPAQARELYRRNPLRIIPDATYKPVPILAAPEWDASVPLDLSHSVLRSVSPVHLEYMRNMGTMASMSISILHDGELWGLISCHNEKSHRVAPQIRGGCDLLTRIFALQLAALERSAESEYRMRLGSIQARLLGHMAEEQNFIDGLTNHPDALLALADARGAAIVSGDYCRIVGEAPPRAEVIRLFEWLSGNHREDVFATDALSSAYEPASAYADRASGLLAISISKMHASYVLWFRPEVVRTVKWGGDPQKPVRTGGGPATLHPRQSFEIWKETVRHRSLPWRRSEIETAMELRNTVVGIVLRRAEELASVSQELQRSNKELEAFSYSVSHDLRAPFRHIVGYSELLRKQDGEKLGERGRRYIETIIESAMMAGTLVDNLLTFSQMGRSALKPRRIDMNALVNETRRRLALETSGREIVWMIGDLAPAQADPVMLRLVVENLMSNAVKYTRGRDEAVISIRSEKRPGEVVYSFEDNGVGFDMAYVGKLFGVFQRLHRMEDFEGTGIGLANVRRIVERHGGRTWAEGEVDKGARFFFSLPDTSGAE